MGFWQQMHDWLWSSDSLEPKGPFLRDPALEPLISFSELCFLICEIGVTVESAFEEETGWCVWRA